MLLPSNDLPGDSVEMPLQVWSHICPIVRWKGKPRLRQTNQHQALSAQSVGGTAHLLTSLLKLPETVKIEMTEHEKRLQLFCTHTHKLTNLLTFQGRMWHKVVFYVGCTYTWIYINQGKNSPVSLWPLLSWPLYYNDLTSLSAIRKVLPQDWDPWDWASSPISNKARRDTMFLILAKRLRTKWSENSVIVTTL